MLYLKVITTTGKNALDTQISGCRRAEFNEKRRQLYDAIDYKKHLFVKRKSVVHKSKLKKSKRPI